MNKIRVLFLAANPLGTSKLALDEEMRLIDEKVYASELRDQLELVTAWAARPDDLLQALNRYRPQVVHFSGHGTPTGDLQFVGNDGFPRPVSSQALTSVFKTFKHTIRLVLLNACYSRVQAEAILQAIECVVGMNAAIGDTAARTFSASFYRAIGFGGSIQEAFEQGKSALLLEGIIEASTPELLVRPGTDSTSIGLLHSNTSKSSQMQRNELSQDPFCLADNPLHYFTDIQTFLDAEGHWFREDFERGRIYTPQTEYFEEIEKILQAKHRVLLVGRAAAGKTVLALAFAKHLQEQEQYRVGYKDVRQAEVGDGRKWYALAREHDQPGILYILDNCHLAPREVDEFCRQWKEQAPTHAQCLLVSRTNSQETTLEESSYFHLFADDEKVQVCSEDIYLQVIEQYVTTLRQQTTEYENAFISDDRQKLEKQHAHNLVVSRSRLDVWEALGPRYHLSEVRQEDLYRALETKYLSVYGNALATLCVLQRYEVRAHTFFVEKNLPQDEIKQLQQEKLLTYAIVTGYGRLYDLSLHPAEARELFLASVFNQYGHVTQENINLLVTSTLEAYLYAKPLNYITLYDSLARQRHEDILRRLLINRGLQERTAEQFSRETLVDAVRYVYKVARLDRDGATRLMDRIVRISSVQDISVRLLKLSFQDIAVLLQALEYIDAKLAEKIVQALSLEQLAQHSREESIQDLFRLLRIIRNISPAHAQQLLLSTPIELLVAKTTVRNFQDMVKQLHMYEYGDKQLLHFVESLDMQQFVQQSDSLSLQSLFWTLHSLEKLSQSQTRRLLYLFPLELLAMKSNVSNIGSIDQMLQLMQRIGCTREQKREFVETLDLEQVAFHAKQGNVRRFASLLRTLKTISASIVARLLERVTPAELAIIFQTQETTLADLEQLRKGSTKAFWDAFLQQCSAQHLAELFRRTPLGSVGTFCFYQHTSSTVQAGYQLFEAQFLRDRLVTEAINEIGELLDRLSAIPRKGRMLARKTLELLVISDLTERVAHANLLEYALLLHHARTIDEHYLPTLLAPLRQSTVLQQALEASSVHGIQLLIFNIAIIDVAYLPYIQQGLLTSNIAEKLESAPVRDIGLFLWNTYSYLDKHMAQQYCDAVAGQLRVPQLHEASPEDMCFFLWNLTSISAQTELQIFRNPGMIRLLSEGWANEIGWTMVLFGIATIAHESIQPLFIPEEALAAWFATRNGGHNPYFLALALKGVRANNARTASDIVRSTLPLAEVLAFLQSAKSSAITSRSIQLMEETIRWIEKLLEEEKS